MKKFKFTFILIGILAFSYACTTSSVNTNSTSTNQNIQDDKNPYLGEKVVLTENEWKERLTNFEYEVLRESGTERSFSGEFWDHHEHGVYTCNGCDLELFESTTKFESGTGWPSYYQPINPTHVGEIKDYAHGWNRVEVICNRCEGHLGHVFKDGPEPTGLRYCINSASLNFVKK